LGGGGAGTPFGSPYAITPVVGPEVFRGLLGMLEVSLFALLVPWLLADCPTTLFISPFIPTTPGDVGGLVGW
jgi:hypothetical protein